MDAISQQKKKGQAHFRIQIDELLADSPFTKQLDQLTPDVLQQILGSSQKELLQNGKISLDKLTEAIYSSGPHFNTKDFAKLFNNKKLLRAQDIYQLLKGYDLHEFDLEEEVRRYYFDEGKFSIKKLDKVMGELGYNELNKKDKEIMVECFDYDRDGLIRGEDISAMVKVVGKVRQEKKKKFVSRKQSTIKTMLS